MKKLIGLILTVILMLIVNSAIASLNGFFGDNLIFHYYDDGTLLIEKAESSLVCGPIDKDDWTDTIKNGTKKIEIGSGITEIGNQAFANFTNLKEVVLPAGMTKIGFRSFAFCKNLATINFPTSLNIIGQQAFGYCHSLSSVTLPSKLEYLNDGAFYCCSGLSKVNIPTGVITICGDTFCGCTSLKTITIPSTVENIQERVFMGSGLTSITIPANVLAIDGESFSNCSNLTRIVIENRKLVLGPDMFVGDSKLTIYGYTGSTAEAYAKANNIPFSALEEGSAEPIEKVTLSKLKSVKLKALSAKKLEVKWKKLSKKGQSKIQKIEIQYSTDKTFKTGVKKKWAKKTKNSYTIKGLKKNTKYWVRIRAWKKDGNIIYVSKWVTKGKKTKKK